MRYLLIISLAALTFMRCSRDVQISDENSHPEIALLVHDKILRVNESSMVSVSIADDHQHPYTVSWWTDAGHVDAAGSSMTYTAPDSAGTAIIRVDVRDRLHRIYSDSAEIRIYKQLVFLKADDLDFDWANVISPRWQAFFEVVKSKKLRPVWG